MRQYAAMAHAVVLGGVALSLLSGERPLAPLMISW